MRAPSPSVRAETGGAAASANIEIASIVAACEARRVPVSDDAWLYFTWYPRPPMQAPYAWS
jgi:hypothetical protein